MSCQHFVTFHGLCVQCGFKVVTNLNHCKSVQKRLGHCLDCVGGPQWKEVNGSQPIGLYSRQPKEVFFEDFRLLKRIGKLRLVLDLDETLVHSIVLRKYLPSRVQKTFEISGNVLETKSVIVPESEEINHRNLRNFQGRGTCFTVCGTTYKLLVRPNLRVFLERVSKLYDIHIFTHGTREYAEKILSLSKCRNVFTGIYARDNPSQRRFNKDLRRLFCSRLRSVVIDDKRSVWEKRDWENVLRIRRFDGDLHDNELNECSSFLCNLHKVFFQRGFKDIRNLLSELRKNTHF